MQSEIVGHKNSYISYFIDRDLTVNVLCKLVDIMVFDSVVLHPNTCQTLKPS